MNAVPRRLFVNGRFLAGPVTAVNAVAAELTAALARSEGRWQVEVAVPPELAAAASDRGLPHRVIGRGGGIGWEQRDLPALRREGVVAGFFNTVPLRGTGYVTMLHDAHVFTTPRSYGRATGTWRRLLSRRAGARGNHLLTVSEHSRNELLEIGLGAPERIGVVHCGLGEVGRVDPDPGLRDRLGLAPRRYCVALASLLPHKNIDLLLRAFAHPALAGTRLVLVGKSTREDFIAAGHRPGPNVLFAGFVSDAELAALYQTALAVCMPSLEEGFGLPALEGMASGCVAVVSDRGALPEVVGEAGLILPASAPAAWVAALAALARDPARRETLERAGRARAAAFTWDEAAARMLAHLDRWFAG